MDIIPDWRTLLVQAAGFFLLLWVFKAFLFKPIMGIIDARRQEIEGRYTAAEKQQAAADQSRAEYEQRLAAIEEETREKIAHAVSEGQAMRDEILAESRGRADDILMKARDQIEREKDHAVKELKGRVADLAIDAAGKIMERELDDASHREMVDAFIEDVDEVRQ